MTQKYQLSKSFNQWSIIHERRYEHPSHLANKLFKCCWVINTASPLTFTRFVGKHVFPRPKLPRRSKSWLRRYSALCSARCVAFGYRSREQHGWKNTLHTQWSFVFITMNWLKTFRLTTDWKTGVSFSLFHISQLLVAEFLSFFLSSFPPSRQDYCRYSAQFLMLKYISTFFS